MDQVLAKHFTDQTLLPSMELGIDAPSLLGSCDINYSCTYTNTLSWVSPTQALPVTVNPRDVFERLFGDGDALDPASRRAQAEQRASILDFVRDDATRLDAALGSNDRRKMDQYLTSVRDVERRVQKAAQYDGSAAIGMVRPRRHPRCVRRPCAHDAGPAGAGHAGDLTRVSTFMIGRELSNRTYPEVGVSDSHHMLSHHGGDTGKIERISRINQLFMQHFAYYLAKMVATPDGSGSLLDSTMVMIGAAFGEPNDHDALDLPILVAGGGLRGNRHVVVPKLTPMSNLMLAMMQRLGVEQDQFGDSTAPLAELAG